MKAPDVTRTVRMKVFKPQIFSMPQDKYNLGIMVTSHGDPSVGMQGAQSVLITNAIAREDLEKYPDQRKDNREFLTKFFQDLHDDQHTDVVFDDECFDCGNFLVSKHVTQCCAPPKYAKEYAQKRGSEFVKMQRKYFAKGRKP